MAYPIFFDNRMRQSTRCEGSSEEISQFGVQSSDSQRFHGEVSRKDVFLDVFSRGQPYLLLSAGHSLEHSLAGNHSEFVPAPDYFFNFDEVSVFVKIYSENLVDSDIVPRVIFFELPNQLNIIDLFPLLGRNDQPDLNLQQRGRLVARPSIIGLDNNLIDFAEA